MKVELSPFLLWVQLLFMKAVDESSLSGLGEGATNVLKRIFEG